MARRPSLAAVVIVVAALAFTGCSGGGASAVEVVRATPAKTATIDIARVSFTIKGDTGPLAKGLTTTGVFNFEKGVTKLQLDPSSLGIPGVGKIEAISTGDVLYMKLPQVQQQIPGVKEWIKLDLAAAAKQAGVDYSGLTSSNQSDPSQALQLLNGANEDMRKVGSETLHGTKTSHYRGTVELKRAIAAAPKAVRSGLETLVDKLELKNLPVDVWVDDGGRMRRQRYTIDTTKLLPAGASSGGGPTTFTYELYDFGVNADVAVPKPDQVTDMAELARLVGQGQGGTATG